METGDVFFLSDCQVATSKLSPTYVCPLKTTLLMDEINMKPSIENLIPILVKTAVIEWISYGKARSFLFTRCFLIQIGPHSDLTFFVKHTFCCMVKKAMLAY